jgi:hypothetical protein
MHLEDEQVQRWLHGELSRPGETAVREHVARCAPCRERVAEAEREEHAVHALLRGLDHAAPPIDAQTVAASARRVRHVGWIRWAAALVLALGLATAAYAVPGSPARAWVDAMVRWLAGDAAPAPAPGPVPGREGVAGIAVVPGRELVILFTSNQAGGQAHVSLTQGAAVVVRAVTGAATFTSDDDRLVIDNRSAAATFEIEVPVGAPWVEIRVAGNRILLKEGSRVTAGTSADPRGVYVLPLVAPGS